MIQPSTMKRKYSTYWENEFSGLVYDEDINGAFCRVCKQTTAENSTQEVFGSQNRSRIGRKLPRECKLMKEVASTFKPVSRTSHVKTGSVVQQLQRVGMQEREKNRAAMKSLVRCTHFLPAPYCSTNFNQLVDLVMSCGAWEFQVFVENALHFSRGSGCWLYWSTWNMGQGVYFKGLQKAPVFSVMADECTNINITAVRNCRFSVVGRKIAFLSNAFWTLCL